MRTLVQLLFFLALVDEGRSIYTEYFAVTPFAWVHRVLFEAVANVRPFDVLMLVVLAVAASQGAFRKRVTGTLRRTLLVAVGVTLLAAVYGLATGGDGRAAGWQAYLPMSMILATFAIAATHHTAEHFTGLLKGFVAAGVVHAVMCILFDRLYVTPGRIWPTPEYAATHDDTVIWTASIWLLLLMAAEFPGRRTRGWATALVPLILVAIQLNRRRLAWVSLIGSGVALYFVLPEDRLKRRIKRVFAIALPIVLLYTAIGWGRPEAIFMPLRSFTTVSVQQDDSTKARNMENLGLIATASKHGWLLGSGWGQKYVEVSSKYNIYSFELWPYVPHNSVLGLLAYTGYVGFVGFWMTIPMAAFFHARVARLAARPLDRYVATVGLVQLVVCADQWYGDMGAFSPFTMYTLAATLAAALRLPLASAGSAFGDAARRPPAARV